MAVCYHCKNTLPEGSLYCEYCGQKQPDNINNETAFFCQKCGATVSSSEVFCATCGEKIEIVEPSPIIATPSKKVQLTFSRTNIFSALLVLLTIWLAVLFHSELLHVPFYFDMDPSVYFPKETKAFELYFLLMLLSVVAGICLTVFSLFDKRKTPVNLQEKRWGHYLVTGIVLCFFAFILFSSLFQQDAEYKRHSVSNEWLKDTLIFTHGEAGFKLMGNLATCTIIFAIISPFILGIGVYFIWQAIKLRKKVVPAKLKERNIFRITLIMTLIVVIILCILFTVLHNGSKNTYTPMEDQPSPSISASVAPPKESVASSPEVSASIAPQAQDPFDEKGFVFAHSDKRLLTRSEIMEKISTPMGEYTKLDILGFARNEIYARHGNVFTVKRCYIEYYASCEWYTPIKTGVDDSDFNTIEIENYQLIKEIEKELEGMGEVRYITSR